MTLYRKTIWLFWTAFLSFLKDDCLTKAATLTFYTLQATVPILAFFIALAKGFGLDRFLEEQLTSLFSEQGEALNFAINFANTSIKQITSGPVFRIWHCVADLDLYRTSAVYGNCLQFDLEGEGASHPLRKN